MTYLRPCRLPATLSAVRADGTPLGGDPLRTTTALSRHRAEISPRPETKRPSDPPLGVPA